MIYLGNYRNLYVWNERIFVGKVMGDKDKEVKVRL